MQKEIYGQFGYNAEGEIGNGTTEEIHIPFNITNSKIKVESDKIINLQAKGNTSQIRYSREMGLNLLTSRFLSESIEFKSLDEDVATVSSSGLVTAVGTGTTYIRITDKVNDIYGSVKVNVNGEGNVTQAKIIGGNNHFVALKGDGTVWTWGYNGEGSLGSGDYTKKVEPQKALMKSETGDLVPIEDAIDIACGTQHTIVLRKDGTVWTSGYNGYGGLGNGATAKRAYFDKVMLKKPAEGEEQKYLEDIVEIACRRLIFICNFKNRRSICLGI